jgi:hypothetical protein
MASKFSQRILVGWSTLALAAGCSQILGLGDYDIDPKLHGAGGGDSGGEPGDAGKPSAGSKPSGGSSSGGEPSSEGGGGTGELPGGGSAGEPGSAGAGGSAEPDAKFLGCNGTPFEGNEAILASCILRVGCQPWAWPTDTISRCVSQNAQATYEGTKCTLDATSCDDITACEGLHIETEFCDDKAPGSYCNGDELVTCGDYPHAKDCVKYGGTCHDFGVDLDGLDTTVACSLPAVTTCAATTAAQECGGPSNAYAFQCQGKIAYGSKCNNFAASCQEVGGDVGCFYPLNTCSVEGVSCANDRATWCDGDSKAVFDCASVGLGCATEGDYTLDSGRQCAAPGCEAADIAKCKESCDGTKLTICYGGAPVTVDCKDYGFAACNEYTYDLCDGTSTMNDCIYTDDVIPFAQCE